MAHTTVIKFDKSIYIDGEQIDGCDMSGFPDDFHALQWSGTEGHIEYTGVNRFDCAVTWLPMLLIEGAQQTRQSGAAIESFRNEMVRLNENPKNLLT
jgi:hypothetical protein